jgi:hypothetical protein
MFVKNPVKKKNIRFSQVQGNKNRWSFFEKSHRCQVAKYESNQKKTHKNSAKS